MILTETIKGKQLIEELAVLDKKPFRNLVSISSIHTETVMVDDTDVNLTYDVPNCIACKFVGMRNNPTWEGYCKGNKESIPSLVEIAPHCPAITGDLPNIKVDI